MIELTCKFCGADIDTGNDIEKFVCKYCGNEFVSDTASRDIYKNADEELISKDVDINGKNEYGFTYLHKAVIDQNKNMVKLLISMGANVNCKDNNDDTPLHWASARGYKEIAELLITKDADVNVKNIEKATPLLYAIDEENIEIAELLIKNGAKINIKTRNGITPLQLAVTKGYKEIAHLLIINGADINARDTDKKQSPLFYAISKKNVEIVELLISNGADVNVKDKNGETPIIYLLHFGIKDYNEIAELLITKDFNINTAYEDGNNLLHYIISNFSYSSDKEEKIIKLLLSKGIDVNAKNNNDMTPLDIAVKERKNDFQKILRFYGGRKGYLFRISKRGFERFCNVIVYMTGGILILLLLLFLIVCIGFHIVSNTILKWYAIYFGILCVLSVTGSIYYEFPDDSDFIKF